MPIEAKQLAKAQDLPGFSNFIESFVIPYPTYTAALPNRVEELLHRSLLLEQGELFYGLVIIFRPAVVDR